MITISKRAHSHRSTCMDFFTGNPMGTPAFKGEILDISPGDPTVRPFEFNSIESKEIREKLLDSKTYHYCEKSEEKAIESILSMHNSKHHTYAPEDVFITQGGEWALTYIMRAMCEAGDNYIVPSPGYWHLSLVGACYGAECRTYGFKDEQWSIDFDEIVSKIDERTKFLLVVSPGNPNCVYYDYTVLKKFIDIAAQYGLFIVSDEIYINNYYEDIDHISICQIETDVPIVTMSGLAKSACVPGFGLEWILLKDSKNKAENLRQNLEGVVRCLGTNSAFLVSIVPDIIEMQVKGRRLLRERMQHIKKMYEVCWAALGGMEGIEPKASNSAMFISFTIKKGVFDPELEDDILFCRLLYQEQGVKLGRGSFNGQKGLCRISLILCENEYVEALKRLAIFVKEKSRKKD